MTPRVEVIGAEVPDAPEPCHLVEVAVTLPGPDPRVPEYERPAQSRARPSIGTMPLRPARAGSRRIR